ncbi:hypothetical protein [Nonomuraea sp. NPDC046570]|uniref:hypothetical protein n=1 Tax=Nonomuraea sp. NPDC046570 TaxID=3155255 RepID=UPI0033FF2E6F
MTETASVPPWQVRCAVVLLWSVVPIGLVVGVINVVAVAATDAALPYAPVVVNAEDVPEALRQFAGVALERAALIALGFAAAALLLGTLASLVRRGVRRRPAALPLLAGVIGTAYLLGLTVAYFGDPISSFERVQGADALLSEVPFDMDAATPPWFAPALAVTLTAAATAQITAMVLIAGRTTTIWVRRPTPEEGTSARAAVLAQLGPAFVAVYALVGYAAIWVAGDAAGGGWSVRMTAGSANTATTVFTTILGLLALLLTWCARRARRGTPAGAGSGALTSAGVLTALYLLALYAAWRFNAISPYVLSDDQSGFSEARPWWQPPALTLTLALAALAQVAGLAGLSGRPTPAASTGRRTGRLRS